jgi:diguanylate cyclase (GGDEF)-like protein
MVAGAAAADAGGPGSAGRQGGHVQDLADEGAAPSRAGSARDERESVLGALAPVLDAVARVHGWADPDGDRDSPLQDVLEEICRATGFGAGALSHVLVDGTIRIVAVVGPECAREALLGVEIPTEALEAELDRAEHWGRLRFLPAGTVPKASRYRWTADAPPPTEPDGWHPEDTLLAPLRAGSGLLIGILSVDLPVSGRRPDRYQLRLLELLAGQAEAALQNARRAQRLRASEESFRLAFESTAVGMGLVALDARTPPRLLSANRALDRIAGAAGLDAGAALAELLGGAGADRAPRPAPGGVLRAERQLGGAEGPWVQVTSSELPRHTTEEGRAMVMVEDVTERRRVQWDLEQRATRDALTGLADRSVLAACLTDAVAAARAGAPPGALLFCDLDDFKSVNDLFGHLAGDAVLRACAERLGGEVGERGRVFRIGGDEFAVVLHAAADAPDAVDRICAAATAPVEHGGRRLEVGLSVGWCAVDGRSDAVEDLLEQADAAMYRNKRRHRRIQPPEPARA